MRREKIEVRGAYEHNLKHLDVEIPRGKITVVTGVSGSGKSSLAFDTLLREAQRRFFHSLTHYSRQFLDLGNKPKVRGITGLSPAIGLAQYETKPSVRATVGSFTDISELIGVLYARFGTVFCPTHHESTEALSIGAIGEKVASLFPPGQMVAVCSPLATMKKGAFRKLLDHLAEKGFMRVLVDGAVLPLNPTPELHKDDKHTLKLIVDHVRLGAATDSRLLTSIQTAVAHGEGFVECIAVAKNGQLDLASARTFSTIGSCPRCGYSAPKLDSRYFSANSLGRCIECQGLGSPKHLPFVLREDDQSEDGGGIAWGEVFAAPCEHCQGTGLTSTLQSIRLQDRSVIDLNLMPLHDLVGYIKALSAPAQRNPAMARVIDEIATWLTRLTQVGLGYLNLARRIISLSGGEVGRLKIAGILSESLCGVMYILDEPSQGLHPRELEQLQGTLERLRDLGNTVILVDHDEFLMRHADWIVDLGPGGGRDGGRIQACFRPGEADQFKGQSLTAKFLSAPGHVTVNPGVTLNQGDAGFITVYGARLNNLRIPQVRFQLCALNTVTGVSGAGKSSLVLHTLQPNLELALVGAKGAKTAWSYCERLEVPGSVTQVHLVDRRPLAKTTVSMPATYLDVFTPIRTIYSKLPEAQMRGFDLRVFSLNAKGGRCEECRGRGEIILTMKFLADARVPCSYCKGRRYRSSIETVKFNGLSIADVLNLSIDEACEHFKNYSPVADKLRYASSLGLGYLSLGQPTASLSGGESQRLKLTSFLCRKNNAGAVFILDEPTLGLHFNEVFLLLRALQSIVTQGATVILVEHNQDLVAASQWVVELGPGAAGAGGQLVLEGPRAAHT